MKSTSVNLGEFLKVIGRCGFEQETAALQQSFEKYGIDDTPVYIGPEEGDGKILFTYKMGNEPKALNGILRFSENGKLIDGSTGESVFTVSKKMAAFIIAGLFGNQELTSPLNSYDQILLGGVESSKACYDNDSSTICNYSGITRAFDEIKRQEEFEEGLHTLRAHESYYEDRRAAIKNHSALQSRTSSIDSQIIKNPKNIADVQKNLELVNIKIEIANNILAPELLPMLELSIEEKIEEIKSDEPIFRNKFSSAAKKVLEYRRLAESGDVRTRYCAARKTLKVLMQIHLALSKFNGGGACEEWVWEKVHLGRGEYRTDGVCVKSTPGYDISERELIEHVTNEGWTPSNSCIVGGMIGALPFN